MGVSPIWRLISVVNVDKHYHIRRTHYTPELSSPALNIRPLAGNPWAAQTRSIGCRLAVGYPNGMRPKSCFEISTCQTKEICFLLQIAVSRTSADRTRSVHYGAITTPGHRVWSTWLTVPIVTALTKPDRNSTASSTTERCVTQSFLSSQTNKIYRKVWILSLHTLN